MTTIACRAALCALLLLPLTAPAQDSDSRDRSKGKFWEKFEEEVDRFVRSMTGEFIGDDFELATNDSTATRIVILRADTTIGAGDTIPANIAFRNGNVVLNGTVLGTLTVTDGELRLGSSAHVTGDVHVYGGGVERDPAAVVEGAIDSRSTPPSQRLVYDIPSERWPGATWRSRIPWQNENTNPENGIFRYNRVEGLFLGLGSEKRLYWDGRRDFGAYGSIGYGFSAHRWRGLLGVTRQFALDPENRSGIIEIGVEGYTLTESKDQWTIAPGENTAAAFLIHEDFRDYFERRGVTAFAAWIHRSRDLFAEGKIAYAADRYASLDVNTGWSLFGGSKVFRPNPAIDEGNMRSIQITAGFSTAERMRRGPEGWTASLQSEIADRSGLGGEFTFQSHVLDVRRFQRIGSHDNLNLRLRLGTSHGDLPRQRSFELGGPGTIPGIRFKEIPSDTLGANRMILANGEYLVNGDFLGDLEFWPSWLMRYITIILMADAGFVRRVEGNAGITEGFDGIRWKDFRSDIGLALGNRSGSFRIGAVWRTDRAEAAQFVLRFARPF